jgi:hypothetical protein
VSDQIEAARFLRFLNVDTLLGDPPVYMALNQSIGQSNPTPAQLLATPSLWLAQVPIQTRYTYDLGKPYTQCHVYLFRGDGGMINGRLDTEVEPFGDIIDRIPAGSTDVVDRPGRLLGHVTVDAFGLPLQAGSQNTFDSNATAVNVQTLIFATNLNRKKVSIHNRGLVDGAVGYIEISEGSIETSAIIGPGQTYETNPPVYTGPIYFTNRINGNIHVMGIEDF